MSRKGQLSVSCQYLVTMLSADRDDLSVLREEICQGNLKILPEKILFPFQEKEWKQLYRCASNKENRVDS